MWSVGQLFILKSDNISENWILKLRERLLETTINLN